MRIVLSCVSELVDKNQLLPVFLEVNLHIAQDPGTVCLQSNSVVAEKHETSISLNTAPTVAVYSLVKQPVVVLTHWFNKVCCCTVINSVKP